jgi:hypothetical protein
LKKILFVFVAVSALSVAAFEPFTTNRPGVIRPSFGVGAPNQFPVIVDSNGVILSPTNFTVKNGLTGGAFTNLAITNISNGRYVINVRDFGAKGDGVTDDTLAISNAQVAQVASRLPLYFPAVSQGKYYKISGPLRPYDGSTDLRGVNIPYFDTASRIEIMGDTGATIVQTSDNNVFVFTNGLNWLKISGLNIVSSVGQTSSSSAGIALYCQGFSGGQNTDNAIIENTEVDGFKYGLYSESGCIMNLRELSLDNNLWSFWLVGTNKAGDNATGNNSVTFLSCDFIGNYNGGYLEGGGVVTFDGCEEGAPTETNYVTISTLSGTSVIFRGGNSEHYQGAIVNMVGGGLASTRVRFDNFGFHNFQNASLVWNTNLSATPYITIADSAESGGLIHDDCPNHQVSVFHGAVQIVGSNQWSGAFTNYVGEGSRQIMSADGVNYNGAAPNALWEGQLSLKYNYDSKHRSMLSYGAVSNWGSAQTVFNYPLLQYNYDLADGKIPYLTVSNDWTAIQRFDGGAILDGSGGSMKVLNNSLNGPFFQPTIGRMGFSIIQNNFTTDDTGFYFNRNNVTLTPTASTGVPLLYWDGAGNKTHVGWVTANSQPNRTATLNVYGSIAADTNAAPTNVTVGTISPDYWFKWTAPDGSACYVPAWKAH